MNEFEIECCIFGEGEFSSVEEGEMDRWKKEMEVRALSEYHRCKVEISGKGREV